VPMPCLDIVIPVYNEEKNILRVLKAFEKEVNVPIRVFICYDHETDTTLPVLNENRFSYDVIPIKNKGKGAHGAVITGLYESDAHAVISYMADDDYNAAKLNEIYEKSLQGYDIVCPSRFIHGGSMKGCRWQKAFLVRSVAFTLHFFGGLPVHDPTNGFRMFSRRLLECVEIESKAGFTYSIELLAKCQRLGWPIYELPVQWIERSDGKSRFNIFKWAGDYLQWYFYIFATKYKWVYCVMRKKGLTKK
jgi:dolichol-phosphate mannosyltransferase